MSLHFRPKTAPNAPWYAPNRDVVQLYPVLLRHVALGLEADAIKGEKWLNDFAVANNVTEEQIGQAMVKFVEFMKWSYDPDVKSPFEALTKTGFLDLPAPVQYLVSAKLGQILTGAFWHGVREVASPGEDPTSPKTLNELCEASERVAKVMLKSALGT